jgi:hypothetical protein
MLQLLLKSVADIKAIKYDYPTIELKTKWPPFG